MDEVLERALAPVMRDAQRSGAPGPRVVEDDWAKEPDTASAMLWGGSATGVRVRVSADEAERVAEVADQVQEWVIEELWGLGAPTNWPGCPSHPHRHPLAARVVDGAAVWVCPADQGAVVVRIGQL